MMLPFPVYMEIIRKTPRIVKQGGAKGEKRVYLRLRAIASKRSNCMRAETKEAT